MGNCTWRSIRRLFRREMCLLCGAYCNYWECTLPKCMIWIVMIGLSSQRRHVLKEIKEGNEKTKWKDTVPYAYWKGNPFVTPTRKDLMKCNVTEKDDWNTHLCIQVLYYIFINSLSTNYSSQRHNLYVVYVFWTQDWDQESSQGYKKSNLGDQCTHRYVI